MSAERLDWKERLRNRVVEILALAVVAFIVVRITMPRYEGRRELAREAHVLDVLRSIHDGETEVSSDGAPMKWLSELVAAAPPASALRTLAPRPATPEVELFESSGYLFALYVVDTGRSDDRAWSKRQSTGESTARGYAAFAWPARYGRDGQWAYFIDQRGKLLGSWNHSGLFDGTNPPFPPTAHPLRDYLSARKEGDDSEWMVFSDLPEIVPPPIGG